MTLKLPRHVAAARDKATRAEREELSTPEIVRAAVAMSSLRATSGFMMLHLAFWLRNEKAGLAWFGFALAIGSASTLLANSIGASLTRKLNHHSILVSSLCVIAITGIISALNGGITAGIVLAGVVNGFGAIGKLAFDSIVQKHAPDANRSRVFAQYETRNQLFQVAPPLTTPLSTSYSLISRCSILRRASHKPGASNSLGVGRFPGALNNGASPSWPARSTTPAANE